MELYEGYEKSKDGTKNPWYETSILWYEKSGSGAESLIILPPGDDDDDDVTPLTSNVMVLNFLQHR